MGRINLRLGLDHHYLVVPKLNTIQKEESPKDSFWDGIVNDMKEAEDATKEAKE